jgi:DNA (cytosine-5)-methyltransferase 1
MNHRFPYKWNLSDGYPAKGINYHGSKVFSCFACGGGSTMGYKLAGYDVIGCNEIDPKMMAAYIENHHPKFVYLEDIRVFKLREDLPQELYELDILDGSPPCSSFSMAGNREKDWGTEKKFREGQADQVLDTLFFDFIDLAKKLQPKVVIAENVKGLMMGEAWSYMREIYKQFDEAGYYCQHFLLDASKMGVPQRRERVFFLCLRKDLAGQFLYQKDMFDVQPKIEVEFNENEISFSQFDEQYVEQGENTMYPSLIEMWNRTEIGSEMIRKTGTGAISHYKINPKNVLNTIIGPESAGAFHWKYCRGLTKDENCSGGSYPHDYNFLDMKSKYFIGMSVPPVMMAQVATEIFNQWLSKL